MNTITLQNRQLQLSDLFGQLNLPVFEAVIQACRKTVKEAGRLLNNLKNMAMKAVVYGYSFEFSPNRLHPKVYYLNDDGSLVENDQGAVDINSSEVDNTDDFISRIKSGIETYAANQSYTIDEWIWMIPKLGSTPQAAISDAPADAVTNYNVVTTLLGTLTGALNTANTKQNDIANKLNTLLSELRAAKIISA